MGFYIDLSPVSPKHSAVSEFAERAIPAVFWVLYAILGFALTCMIWAAFGLLGDLLKTGSWFDRALLGLLAFFVLGYLVAGIKLAWVRRFVAFGKEGISFGSRLAGRGLLVHRIAWKDIAQLELINHRPTPNWAVAQHDDPQYQVRGHWRLVAKLKNGKEFILDRHVEKEALHPLFEQATTYLNAQFAG